MRPEWIRVSGIVVKGYRVASGMNADSPYPEGSIKMQLPLFRERGLDLTALFPATLNVSLSPSKFTIKNPRYAFQEVKWSPDHPAEDFWFSPCRVSFKNRLVDGFVYYPHPETKLNHFQDPSTIEVIAEFIKGIRYGESVQLEIDANEILIQLDSKQE